MLLMIMPPALGRPAQDSLRTIARDSAQTDIRPLTPIRGSFEREAGRSLSARDRVIIQSDSIARHDSIVNTAFVQDSTAIANNPVNDTTATQGKFVPDSNKALWFAALCPGLGQIYNRRYWKLPIVAGGIVGVSYAISWNGKYYTAYTLAYRDLIDNDPSTNYFNEILPPGAHYSESQMQTLFKNRQQSFRRQRDLSIIVGVGLYLICLLDAYVDAELFTFDISDNLSFQWGGGNNSEPLPEWRSPNWMLKEPQSLNLSFSLNF